MIKGSHSYLTAVLQAACALLPVYVVAECLGMACFEIWFLCVVELQKDMSNSAVYRVQIIALFPGYLTLKGIKGPRTAMGKNYSKDQRSRRIMGSDSRQPE